MSKPLVELSFPAKPDYLVLARLAVAGVARAFPIEPEVLADLKLAVTEACGNAVQHAYGDDQGYVKVAMNVVGERLELVVEDEGTGLEPAEDEEWTMPAQLEGGMGMAIIRSIVDELEVAAGTEGRGTIVRMTKYLSTAS